MKLMDENDLLNLEFRKAVIEEIMGPENVARRTEHERRYQVYKDQTVKWVLNSFAKEGLKPETLAQMSNRATNVSICRKIINKLARTYAGGVSRSGKNDADTAAIEAMAEYLSMTSKMRKADRYRELHKNCALQFVQEICGGTYDAPLYRVGMRVLSPWQYDVIEDAYDREIPRVFILSDFTEQNQLLSATENDAGKHVVGQTIGYTNRKDDTIADAPGDAGEGSKRIFIWWSQNFHFTTYADGTICTELSEPDLANPIKMLPFVNNAEDQDGQFWAQGGDDVTDGSILVNKQMTDMNFIAYLQGFGQFVITGKNLKDKYSLGPNNAMVFDYDAEDPEPKVTVVSASPPIDSWLRMIEQYVAMLLSTNNLAPTSIAGKLDAASAVSGIAKLIDSSEATNDISDKKVDYVEKEKKSMVIVQAWQKVINESDEADPAFKALPALPEDVGTTEIVKFNDPKQTITEAEKLANLKLRKDLGIDTMVDLIMLDNPDLSQEQAEKKLADLMAEKLANSKLVAQATGQTSSNGAPATDQTTP